MPSAPDATIAMVFEILISFFKMIGIIKRLSNYIPLQRGTVTVINCQHFVCTPAKAAMINNNIFLPDATKCIIRTCSFNHPGILVAVTHTKAHVTNDDVVATKTNWLIGNTNSITGCGLTGDCYITFY